MRRLTISTSKYSHALRRLAAGTSSSTLKLASASASPRRASRCIASSLLPVAEQPGPVASSPGSWCGSAPKGSAAPAAQQQVPPKCPLASPRPSPCSARPSSPVVNLVAAAIGQRATTTGLRACRWWRVERRRRRRMYTYTAALPDARSVCQRRRQAPYSNSPLHQSMYVSVPSAFGRTGGQGLHLCNTWAAPCTGLFIGLGGLRGTACRATAMYEQVGWDGPCMRARSLS